jgi:hypothetical protein
MKWIGYWSGIEIIAESEEDNKTLETLFAVLPELADGFYDDGIVKLTRDDDTDFVSLEFMR